MANRRSRYNPSAYLSFDGAANSYVALASPAVVPNAAAALSGAVWVYLGPPGAGSTDQIRTIIGNRRDSSTSGWNFKVSNKAQNKIEVTFFDQNTSSQGWISNVTVPQYRWTHIGFTFDGRQVIFYIDGNADPKETLGTPKTITQNASDNLRIGHRQAAGSTFETFSGKMSQLALWNRVLTAAEFMSLFLAGTIPTSGLLASWPMTDGAGSTLAETLNVYPGSIPAGVTWATTVLDIERTLS